MKFDAMVAMVGFLIVMGSIGGMDNPDQSLFTLGGAAVAGLGLMLAGIMGVVNKS